MTTAVAIVLLGLWGWRHDEAWMWWTSLCATVARSAGAMVIHFLIHYAAFIHPLRMYFDSTMLATALILAHAYPMSRGD